MKIVYIVYNSEFSEKKIISVKKAERVVYTGIG